MRYLRCTGIDTKTFEANSDVEAIKKFHELIKYEVVPTPGGASKDYYLCKIVAIHGSWNEGKGLHILNPPSKPPTAEEIKKKAW